MIKFSDLQPGDIVIADFEGSQNEGIVKALNREDKEVCIQTGESQYWFKPADLHAIPLNEDGLKKLNFESLENANGVKYMKGAFRILIPKKGNFSDFEMWYREDRRHIKQPISLHELQNHYYSMTKVELNAD
ncbi:MAG: hypothetical protein EAZ16_06650 [Sphingobacteriales bacterium]|nr:MAG: hypothetical protein EAZ16_06650 [Sphingobacteriales bacterium]